MLLIDVLDQEGIHDLPLSVLPGCQFRIVQQLVDHGQIMFFTLQCAIQGSNFVKFLIDGWVLAPFNKRLSQLLFG